MCSWALRPENLCRIFYTRDENPPRCSAGGNLSYHAGARPSSSHVHLSSRSRAQLFKLFRSASRNRKPEKRKRSSNNYTMGAVPSKPVDPSTPLQVIGAGYSRTGTTSMYLALQELLQGPVMHGGTVSEISEPSILHILGTQLARPGCRTISSLDRTNLVYIAHAFRRG